MPPALVEHWTTVAVTPLPPGWTNLYRLDNGDTMQCPTPAVLLQELRETTRHGRTVHHKPPHDTRAVFADIDGGELVPASDADNYAGTVPTSEVTREVIR